MCTPDTRKQDTLKDIGRVAEEPLEICVGIPYDPKAYSYVVLCVIL